MNNISLLTLAVPHRDHEQAPVIVYKATEVCRQCQQARKPAVEAQLKYYE